MSAQTNILTSPGFETGDLSGWTSYGNSIGNVSVQSGAGLAHSGTSYLKTYGQFISAPNYSGVYQANPSAPGSIYSANGWVYTDNNDGNGIHGEDAIWLEVTFRDASDNALALYRSAVVTSNNLASFGGVSTWFDLPITNQCSFTNAPALMLFPGTVTNTVTSLVAPAGTVYVQYQVVFAQGADNANASMYFDDLALSQTGGTVVVPPPVQPWNIVWDDEFNGNSINTNVWTFDIGNGGSNPGWGNGELEYYTSNPQNAYVSNGVLNIVALPQSIAGFNYTSARMKTQGLFSTPPYGRIVWRAALPAGTGMWPALWMLGTNFPVVGWPTCGEIDVVENNGAAPTWVQGSLHSNAGGPTAIYNFPNSGSTTNFHIYMLDWEANSIRWYVDGQLYETQSGGAPFNAPFFLIMNLAVGGDYVGNPSVNDIHGGTIFPATMQVDYVRIYEQTAPLQIAVTQSNGYVVLSWPTNIVCHLQALTNSLTGGNWFDQTNASSPFVLAPDLKNTNAYFRLASP